MLESSTSTPRQSRTNSLAPSSATRNEFTSSPPIRLTLDDTSESRDQSPTPSAPAAVIKFEKHNNGTWYRYKSEYDVEWQKWIENKEAYKKWVREVLPKTRKGRNRGLKWGNNHQRSSNSWDSFMEGATAEGEPTIRCKYCHKILQHPYKNGTSGMTDHEQSKNCRNRRREHAKDPRIMEALRNQGEKVAGKLKQRDLPIPANPSQDEWDIQLLRAFLSVGISFNAATNLHLRATWKMLKPQLRIPSPNTLRRRLDEYYADVVKHIKHQLPKGGKVALAADGWTSPNHLSFMCIIGYFITSDWEYKEILLGFENIPEGHTGKEQAAVVFECLDRYNLQACIAKRLSTITSDNAKVNETINSEVSKLLKEIGVIWDPVQNKIGCLAHTVQLVLGVFIDALKLKASNEVVPKALKKGKIAQIVGMPAGFKKIIAKVRQMAIAILASPQRNGYFLNLQQGREEIARSMIRDVGTRWNSTLLMLDRAMALKIYIRHWVQEYPAYRGLLLTEDEWVLLEDVLTILTPFRFYTLWISTTKSITIHRALEVYSTIILRLQKRHDELKNACLDWKVELRDALSQTLEYAEKVWENLDSVHLERSERPRYPGCDILMPIREDTILDFGAMLDPYSRLANFRGWDREDERSGTVRDTTWTQKYRQRFIDYWRANYAPGLKPPRYQKKRRYAAYDSDDSDDSDNDDADQEAMIHDMQVLVEKYLDGEAERILRKEPDVNRLNGDIARPGQYCKAIAREVENEGAVLAWWSNNSERAELYPLLQMARDILSTPAAAVACEAAFSSGRDVCNYRRSAMKAVTIQRSMICKHYDRKDVDMDQQDEDELSTRTAQRLHMLEQVASQYDHMVNKDRLNRRYRFIKKKITQSDLENHRSLTEGDGTTSVLGMQKSLVQIQHDGDTEYSKPLPELPPKDNRVQNLLPRAIGDEAAEVSEHVALREGGRIPRVDWDALLPEDDPHSSDTEEENERRAERDRQRKRAVVKKAIAREKARTSRPLPQRRKSSRTREQANRTNAHKSPRTSRQQTTPTRATGTLSGTTPTSVRPRRLTMLMEEGGYKV